MNRLAYRRQDGARQDIWVYDPNYLSVEPGRERFPIPVVGRHQNLTSEDPIGQCYNPVWRPGHSEIAFTGKGRDGRWSIYLMDLAGDRPRVSPLVVPQSGYVYFQPAWSWDGTKLAYVKAPDFPGFVPTYLFPDSELWISSFPRAGEPVRVPHDGVGCSRPTWSPSGRHLAFGQGANICTIDLRSPGSHRVIFAGGTSADYAYHPSWFGEWIVFQSFSYSGFTSELRLINWGGGTSRPLFPGVSEPGLIIGQPAWSPEGRVTFARYRSPVIQGDEKSLRMHLLDGTLWTVEVARAETSALSTPQWAFPTASRTDVPAWDTSYPFFRTGQAFGSFEPNWERPATPSLQEALRQIHDPEIQARALPLR